MVGHGKGVVMAKRGYRWARVSTPHLYAQYLQGASLEQLGAKYGISHAAVWQRFKRSNLPCRAVGRHSPKVRRYV